MNKKANKVKNDDLTKTKDMTAVEQKKMKKRLWLVRVYGLFIALPILLFIGLPATVDMADWTMDIYKKITTKTQTVGDNK